RVSRPRRRGFRLEHRGTAPCHRDCGSRVAPQVHPPSGPRIHDPLARGNQALLSAAGHHLAPRSGVTDVRVTARGAERWVRGHPWIYRSDVRDAPGQPGLVRVRDPRGKFIGQALYSPSSEIRLRLLERTDRTVDAAWWREHLAAALARREGIDATAYRVVHAEG